VEVSVIAHFKRRQSAAAVLVLASALVACGSTVAPPTVFSQQMDQSTFRGVWPVTASSGILACDTAKGNSVTFSPSQSSTTYAVNGPSINWGKANHWPDAKEIWNGSNWGDFIDTGLKMCETKSNGPSTTAPDSASASSFSDADLRGFYTPLDLWNQKFTPAPLSDCAAQGADVYDPSSGDPPGLSIQHAWRLPGGVLACSPTPSQSAAGHVDDIALYFDPHVDARTALDSAASVLPTDLRHVSSLTGSNRPESAYPNGSCQQEVYSSDTLAAALTKHNLAVADGPDPHKVTIMLSGTGGSGFPQTPYDPRSVHVASIISDDGAPDSDGKLHC
jgi:hypothetical protein